MAMFRRNKTAPANTQESSIRRRLRFGRRKKSDGESVLAKEKKAPAMKMKTWRAQGSERLAIAGARIQEKASHLGGWVRYRMYAFTHCIHPFRRRAAKRAAKHDKIRATELRVQKESAAKSKAAGKRAEALAERIATQSERDKLIP